MEWDRLSEGVEMRSAESFNGLGLAIHGLRFGYRGGTGDSGPFSLDGVSFNCPLGQITCLLGPSGSGKSTVLKLISGELAAQGGTVSLRGNDLTTVPFGGRSTATVTQGNALLSQFTVSENIGAALGIAGVSRSARAVRTAEVLRELDILQFADRRVSQLSGGQAQRAAIARALALKPDILLLDEPTAALDMFNKERLAELLIRLRRILPDTAVLLVSHDREFCLGLADRLALIDEGHTVWEGAPDAILTSREIPLRAHEILGVVEVLGGVAEGEGLRVAATSSRYADFMVLFGGRAPALSMGHRVTVALPKRGLLVHSAAARGHELEFAGVVERVFPDENGERRLDVRLLNGLLWRRLRTAASASAVMPSDAVRLFASEFQVLSNAQTSWRIR